jgi:hypothetical protein
MHAHHLQAAPWVRCLLLLPRLSLTSAAGPLTETLWAGLTQAGLQHLCEAHPWLVLLLLLLLLALHLLLVLLFVLLWGCLQMPPHLLPAPVSAGGWGPPGLLQPQRDACRLQGAPAVRCLLLLPRLSLTSAASPLTGKLWAGRRAQAGLQLWAPLCLLCLLLCGCCWQHHRRCCLHHHQQQLCLVLLQVS